MSAYQFELLKTTRANIIQLIDGLTIDQLNTIPDHFNNNLIWNLGHVLVTQQLLMYKLSGNECYISNDIIDQYRKGTRPDYYVKQKELNYILENLFLTIDYAIDDLAGNKFKEYKTYPTSYNVELKSIRDAVVFNNIHEGLHYGYMMAIKKFV